MLHLEESDVVSDNRQARELEWSLEACEALSKRLRLLTTGTHETNIRRHATATSHHAMKSDREDEGTRQVVQVL